MRRSYILSAILWSMSPIPVSATDAPVPPPVVTDVSDPAQRADIIAELENDLQQLGSAARIESCRTVLDYVQPASSGKDWSWGAARSLAVGAQRRAVLACDDRMIGKFSLTENFSLSRAEVINFIERNCPPGG